MNANTTVQPDGQSWAETCQQLMAGYEAAKAEGDRIGLKVFYGFEYGYDQTDLLVYGLGYDWLMAHPDVHKLDVYDFLSLVHESGGFVVHAHPYRQASYIRMIRLFPDLVDAVEVLNIGNNPGADDLARVYASHFKLPVTAGTDNHFADGIQAVAGLETVEPCDSIEDLIDAIRGGRTEIFSYSRSS